MDTSEINKQRAAGILWDRLGGQCITMLVGEVIEADGDGLARDFRDALVAPELPGYCEDDVLTALRAIIDEFGAHYVSPENIGFGLVDFPFDSSSNTDRIEHLVRALTEDDVPLLDDDGEEFDAFDVIDALEDMRDFWLNNVDPPTVYEWWTVNADLAGRLESRGEIVVDIGSCSVWGRQCTGQSIVLDGVMQGIAADTPWVVAQMNEEQGR